MKRALCILLLLCLSANYSYSDLDTSISSKKRVLIGSPIRQKPAILKEFLQSLEELSRQDIICDYLFVDDNTEQASTLMLEEFCQRVSPHCRIIQPVARDCANTYVCNEITHYWRANIIWKVAAFKDSIINSATKEDYDYLFLIDSDMVLHPKTLEQLIIDNKDIVAEIWWTNWTPNTVKQASVWLTDNYTQYEINPGEELTEQQKTMRYHNFMQKLTTPGLYEVGGLCACTLISKKALQAGARFERIRNLTFWGEDRHFCVRALALGLELFVDTHYPAYHIYRESELAGVPEYKENCRNGIYQI